MAGNCLFNDAFKGEMKETMITVPMHEGPESSVPPKEKECLITKKEAANRLAISVRTLDRLAAQGLIEKIFLGASVRFKKREVAAIVDYGI